MSNNFTIVPTTSSMIGEMSMVIIFFISFCIYISYISAYNTGYQPNFVMFLNFIFDNYSGSNNFKTYIQNIVQDTKSESFTNLENNTLYSGFKNNVYYTISLFIDKLQNIISKTFIKGNKIKITRHF